MSIKAKINEATKKDQTYPYLGMYSGIDRKHEGLVILFNSYRSGMVIVSDKMSPVGHYLSNEWAEVNFTPLSPDQSITLSNQ